MPIFMVRKDDLLSHSRGGDPRSLLGDVQRTFYLVRSGNATRASVTVEHRDGAWQPAVLGQGRLARRVDWTWRQILISRNVTPTNPRLVHIPALNLYLIAHDEGSTPMLTALWDVSGTRLGAGLTVTADEALAQLAAVATQDGDGRRAR
jgi:hypothetical protein